jgi:hypothetical protein
VRHEQREAYFRIGEDQVVVVAEEAEGVELDTVVVGSFGEAVKEDVANGGKGHQEELLTRRAAQEEVRLIGQETTRLGHNSTLQQSRDPACGEAAGAPK